MKTYKWQETKKQIAPEIGEVFEWEGITAKCVSLPYGGPYCGSICVFNSLCRCRENLNHPVCCFSYREDKTNVVFIGNIISQQNAHLMYKKLEEIKAILDKFVEDNDDNLTHVEYDKLCALKKQISELLTEVKNEKSES